MAGYGDPFDPNSGQTWQNWYLNTNPDAGFVKYLQDQGLYGLDPTSAYAKNQYNRTYGLYTSQAAQNPNLGFYDWINGAGLNFKNDYGSLSPLSRGDTSDRSLNARARFMRAY